MYESVFPSGTYPGKVSVYNLKAVIRNHQKEPKKHDLFPYILHQE